MRKIFIAFILLFMPIISHATESENSYDNLGYARSIGFAGIYGFMPDYDKKMYKDGLVGGGAFVYFTPVNTMYGNMIIGFGSSYDQALFRSDRSNQNYVEAYVSNIPLQASIGYSTSSNFVNAWIGVSYSYNMIDVAYRKITTQDGTSYGVTSHFYQNVSGIDAFIGAEYILTKNGMLGIFFEGRYSFIENVVVNKFIPEANVTVKETFSPFVMRYAIGLTLHF